MPCGFVPRVLTSMQYNGLALRPGFTIISGLLIFYIVPKMSLQLSSRLVIVTGYIDAFNMSALRFHPSLMMRYWTISFVVFRQRPNVPSYLRTHLFLQLPFGLLSELPTLMLLSLAILTQIGVMAKAKVAKSNFILMNLVAL